MSEENKALMQRWVEDINKGSLALFDEVYGDCVYYSPATGELKREALKEFQASILIAFPDAHYTIEGQVAEGDKVATRWSFAGNFQKELKGIPPTGRQVRTSGMVIDRIAEGKIVEEREEWDTFGWMQQLGAAPPVGGREIAREAVFNAAKAAYSAYGGLLKDVAEEMGMEKAVALHARRCQALYVAGAGTTRERLGGNEFHLSALSSVFKDFINMFGFTFQVEENPRSLRFTYQQCPMYEGFRSAGLDHQAIELICTGGESSGMAELEKAFPELRCSLRFRLAPDQPCIEEFVLG